MTQSQALNILKNRYNVFLTGPAGSGKTFVLNQYIAYLKKYKQQVAITASTGIAATHLGGITIHSWSGMGIKDHLTEQDIQTLLVRPYLRQRYLQTNVLIIDEVSMLHAHQLDMLNQLCQAFRQNSLPFGGIQVVLSGDLFQLPPVTKGQQPARFVTESAAWHQAEFVVCYLQQQFRQTDSRLESILNAIRYGEVDEDAYLALQQRFHTPVDGLAQPTKLYSHNVDVDAINQQHLQQINGSTRSFDMNMKGQPQMIQSLVNSCLAPQRLDLKIGAQVMFVKNNFDQGYVNGTIGEVVDWGEQDWPLVRTLEGNLVQSQPASWKIEEDNKTKAEVIQIPLRLAWAITIHKSQGMSLDAAEVDLSKSFVPGMGYVALSRVRTLDGLLLKGINNTALRINEQILDLDQDLRRQSRHHQDLAE